MGRVYVLDIKKLRNENKEGSEGEEEEHEIVDRSVDPGFMGFLLLLDILDGKKQEKTHPEKTPEDKKHPDRIGLAIAFFEKERADFADIDEEIRAAIQSDA
jgi:hypothetical protein